MMDLPKKKVTQSMIDPKYAKEVAKTRARGKAHKKKTIPKYVKDYTSNKTLDGKTEMDILRKEMPSAFEKKKPLY